MANTVEIPVVDIKGKQVDTFQAPAALFGIEPNETSVHFAVKGQLFNFWKHNACTKTRSAVRGGGKKVRKQKGTGGARQGGIRGPQWIKGGIVFGPNPTKREFKVNRAVKGSALASILSDRFSSGQIKILRANLDKPQTKVLSTFLKEYKTSRVGVVVNRKDDQMLGKSARNISNVDLLTEEKWTTLDFVRAEALVFSEKAIAAIAAKFAAK